MKRILAMGLLSSLLAACTGASAQWARQPATDVALDGVGRISLPKGMGLIGAPTERTPDYLAYHFRKQYKTHINGTTSYAEDLSVYILAKDYPRTRLDEELIKGVTYGFFRDAGAGDKGDGGLRWIVKEVVYEQHPVTEPSWNIRVDNRERGVVLAWRGFKKDYTIAQAKENLTALFDRITLNETLAADFASRRSWTPENVEASYATNLRVVKAVLAEHDFVLPAPGTMSRTGDWRFFADNERPQQLHMVRVLANIDRPDSPFRTSEKVTYFKYMQERWFQDNQGQESALLPVSGQVALASDFVDRAKVYFYQITPVDLWKTYASEQELAALVRDAIKKLEAEHTRISKSGFLYPDAE